jgi:hypothetical protein
MDFHLCTYLLFLMALACHISKTMEGVEDKGKGVGEVHQRALMWIVSGDVIAE